MSEVICHRPIGTEVIVVESGLALGNTDPRFGTETEVRENRATLRGALGMSKNGNNYEDPEVVYAMVPKGGDKFVDVDDFPDCIVDGHDPQEKNVVADALITRRNNVGLFLGSADCIALAAHDRRLNILSVIHLGWKGATLRLHEKVLDYVAEQFGSQAEDMRAYLGPSIAPESYVTEKLSDAQESDPQWQPFTLEGDKGYHVDVPGFVVRTLQNRGIYPDNIAVSLHDTGDVDGQHYSFTRHKREGVPNGRNGFVALQRPHSLTW